MADRSRDPERKRTYAMSGTAVSAHPRAARDGGEPARAADVLVAYPCGAWGPAAADPLAARHGRFHTPWVAS